MSIAGLPMSVSWIWGNWAVPEDTPNTVGAAGSIQTCTAQGWLNLMFSQMVAVYYASLGVYSFFAIKNNFKQEDFKWIEKWIHSMAWVPPTILCSVVTAHESFNPRGTGCFIAACPFLCEKDGDDDTECDRGGHLSDVFIGIFAFGNIILYLIVPPLAMMLIGCQIKRAVKEVETSVGMKRILVSARKQMMQDVMKQVGLYLLAFWLTYFLPMANGIVEVVTGAPDVNLLIIGNCVSSFQGAILTMVYFSLQRMTNASKRLPEFNPGLVERRKHHITVSMIRNNAEARDAIVTSATASEESQDRRCTFFIFDGTPSDDSPWAQFLIDDDADDENES
jgi:hypothetical protein